MGFAAVFQSSNRYPLSPPNLCSAKKSSSVTAKVGQMARWRRWCRSIKSM